MLSNHDEFNKHVIYYWWNDNPNIKPYQDLKSPVVLSIATLRAFHKKVPITILDVSEFERPSEDWTEFQQVLNFSVVKTKTDMDTTSNRYWKMCSRITDIYNYSKNLIQKNIVFCDADIFFIKKIFPLLNEDYLKDKFCCHPKNTGFFYFNKNLISNQETFDIWIDCIFLALSDDVFFKKLIDEFPYYPNPGVHDEICFRYLLKHKKLKNIKLLDFKENFIFCKDNICKFSQKIQEIRCLHALSCYNGEKKAVVCLFVKELREIIKETLGDHLIKKIFKNESIRPSYELKDIIQFSQAQFDSLLN